MLAGLLFIIGGLKCFLVGNSGGLVVRGDWVGGI